MVSVAAGEAGVDTATHFSFLLSFLAAPSDSSSDVTLSSVSASTPVLVSDSELDDSLVEASAFSVAAAGDSAAEDSDDEEESLLATVTASERAFFALERASLRSSFYPKCQ